MSARVAATMDVLAKASERRAAEDYAGAISILQPLALQHRGLTPVTLALAEVYELAGKPADALDWYSQTIRTLGANTDAFPSNVSLRRGNLLFHLKRYREAILDLERARLHPSYERDDVRAHGLLAESHTALESAPEAVRAWSTVVALDATDAHAWHELTRMSARQAGARAATVDAIAPRLLGLAGISDLLQLGPPSSWTQAMAPAALGACGQSARSLAEEGLSGAAQKMRRACAVGLTNLAIDAPAKERVAVLDQVERDNYPEALAEDQARSFWRLRVITYQNIGNHLLAMRSFGRLARLDLSGAAHELPKADVDLVIHLLLTVLKSVSWDEATQLPRHDDPLDFVGHRVPRPSTSGGPADDIPYGMVDADEDHACLTAWLAVEYVAPVLRQRLAAGNLELPVKALLNDVMMGFSGGRSDSVAGLLRGILHIEFDRVIQNPGVVAEPATLKAYAIAREAIELLRTIPPERRGIEDTGREAPTDPAGPTLH